MALLRKTTEESVPAEPVPDQDGSPSTAKPERLGFRETMAAKKAADSHQRMSREFKNSPIGQARIAFEAGDTFFQAEIDHAELRGHVHFGAAATNTESRHKGTDVLGAIEAEGWRLEQSGWVYLVTGESSRDKFLSSGQQTAVAGKVRGMYLFRRVG